MSCRKKIGIFGGTFSPPHLGHIKAAEAFKELISPDELLIIPTHIPPHKTFDDKSTCQDRIRMCELAFSHIQNTRICDIEIARGGKSYTYLTLEELHDPSVDMYFLLGSDMFVSLDSWKMPERIFELATICCIRRESDPEMLVLIDKKADLYREKYGAKLIFIDSDVLEISSTKIRELIFCDENLANFLSTNIIDYIEKKHLYGAGFAPEVLKEDIKEFMMPSRYKHTLGVADAAKKIASYILPEKLEEIECAALLHDIAKELPFDEQTALAKEFGYTLTSSDKRSPAIIHAYAAPAAIVNFFPKYCKPNVLSAVFNHTVGDPNMSIFDEIVFVADFIEETRQYKTSIEVRNSFYAELEASNTKDECVIALHKALVKSIDHTFAYIKSKGGYVNEKMQITKNAFVKKINFTERS